MKNKIAACIGAVLILAILMACGSGQENVQEAYREDVACADVVTAVAETLGSEYWPDTDMPPEFLESVLGLSADLYDDAAGQTPMISTNVDTLIVVKAKPEQKEAVTGLLAGYQEMLQSDTMQYPMNLGKIQASKVEVFGNYVCFIQLGADTSAMEAQEDVIAHCEAANTKAADAIRQKLTS